MGIDAWHVEPTADGKTPTLLANSTLDKATIDDITSGRRPFPNYGDIPLKPERRLLHEVIIQTVTERQLQHGAGKPYDEQLAIAVERAVRSPAFQHMQQHGEVDAHKVSALLDSLGLERLPTLPNAQRVTVMMATAAPATGKNTLVKNLGESHPDIYHHSAIVNSDDYKLLLATKAQYGDGYANAAHAESAYLSDEILSRLSHKIDVGRAPNVTLDVVTLSDQRMAFVQKSGSLIVAAGTAPPDVTLERSLKRGVETGRIVPSEAVLAGARAVSATTPRIFEHPNAHMELFDTNVPYRSPHKLVAKYESTTRTLVVNEPDVFLDFVERQNLNPKAKNEAQLFQPTDRLPAALARGMKAYTDRGVTLAFLDAKGELAMTVSHDGVDQIRPLTSHRGANFFPELAVAARAAVAMEEMHRRPNAADEQHRASVGDAEPIMASRAGTIGAGVGAGLSMKGIYDDLAGHDSRLKHDMHAGGAQAVAGGARFATQAADTTIAFAATAEGTYRAVSRSSQTMAGVAPALAESGAAMRLAGRAAIPLALAAGTLEASAGVAEHNPKRVAAAVGNTGGGITGGVLGGVIAGAAFGFVTGSAAGSETGAGAIVTAGIGALGGAIWGGMVGEKAAKEHLTHAVDKAMHFFGVGAEDKSHHAAAVQHPTPHQPSVPYAPNAHISPDMQRAMNAAFGSGLSSSIQCDGHHHAATFHAPMLPQKTHGTGVCR